MITAADVQRVAFTARPHVAKPGVELSIDDVIKMTTADDWDGNLYELRLRPAEEIAFQFNTANKMTNPKPLLTKPPRRPPINGVKARRQ